ncbi:MAG: DUF1211 domain-containing protein, partial [Firmicutes bacterium]|nr:DUF1211 domain-containing protein [Bacillota bacterium]
RLAAFTDAILAIIMTILVLELERPQEPTIEAIMQLKYSFFSYTLSFFWLGSMWISIHNEWESISRISTKVMWVNMVLLFSCSLIPYTTDIVSKNFYNSVAQCFFGITVMAVTFSNIWLSKVLEDENKHEKESAEMIAKRRRLLWADILIKVIGFIIAAIVYPPAMMYSVILAALFFTVGRIKLKLN